MKTKQIRRRMRRNFTIVEVALALAVIGVGIASMLVLFPIGMTATQNAIGDHAAANAVEGFIPTLKARAELAGYDKDGNNEFLKQFYAWPVGSASDNLTWDESAVYDSNATVVEKKVKLNGGGDYYFYRVMQKTLSTDGNGGDLYVLDFDGIVRIWADQIHGMRLESYGIESLDRKYGVGVYVELSWPAEKPYEAREKRMYYFEHFNQAE